MVTAETLVGSDVQVVSLDVLKQNLPKLRDFPQLIPYFQHSPWMIQPVAELDRHNAMKSNHSWRLGAAAVGVAQSLNLSQELTIPFVEAAICHDNGFVHIPNNITDKPDDLTQDEQRIVDGHTQDATNRFGTYSRVVAGLIETVHQFQPHMVPDANTLRYYYETKSYQDGLPFLYAHDIPRILSALDKYDAFRDPERRYRSPVSREQAMEAILELRDSEGNLIYANFRESMTIIADVWDQLGKEPSQETLAGL